MTRYRVQRQVCGLLACIVALWYFGCIEASEDVCGFPGSPKLGDVRPNQDLYSEGDIVTYTCRVGYILIGPSIRRCKNDGSWTEEVPVCDESMTILGYASSTAAVPGSPAELAIDRNPDTCTYLAPKNTRWWRVDLGKEHKILSVAITMSSTDKYSRFTVYVVKIRNMDSSYKRCASFEGKFGTNTILLNCAEGRGIEGQRIHIEDYTKTEGLFEICEVDVQVKKDSYYPCGKPNRNPYSTTYNIEGDRVEYGCLKGYELKGRDTRICERNGQWSGEAPDCKAIVCEELQELKNGKQRLYGLTGDVALEGTIVQYNCNEGFRLIDGFNRVCQKDGTWDGKHPHCEAVRCGTPVGSERGGVYELVNHTTRMGSVARLKCRKGKTEGDNPYIICTDNGTWTKAEARCLLPPRTGAAMAEERKIAKKGAIIFGMVVAGFMVAIVLVSLYVVTNKRRRARRPELPCRQATVPDAPPRPPPRTKGISTFLQCVSAQSDRLSNIEADETENDTFKTRSLPLKNTGKPAEQSNRAASVDKPHHGKEQESRDKTRSVSPRSETKSEEEMEIEDDIEEDKKEPEDKQLRVSEDNKKDAARQYAAIDYEKKRKSRLLKEQSSEDTDSSRQGTPLVPEEDNTSSPPTIPPKTGVTTLSSKARTSPEISRDSPEIPPKQTDDELTGKSKRTRATDDDEDATSRNPRRTRTRGEVTTEPETEASPARGTRRTRLRE